MEHVLNVTTVSTLELENVKELTFSAQAPTLKQVLVLHATKDTVFQTVIAFWAVHQVMLTANNTLTIQENHAKSAILNIIPN